MTMTPTNGAESAVLVLDEQLVRLARDPAAVRELLAVRAERDPAATSQLLAAEAEVHNAMVAAGAEQLRHQEVSDWLRLGAVEALVNHLAGTASTCLHAPDPRKPLPIFAAAWRPGLIVCAGCRHLLALHGEADLQCDLCGRVDGSVSSLLLSLGALVFLAGACRGCRADVRTNGRAAR